MKDKPLILELTVEDINTILTALGHLPYMQVFELIQRIQIQAESQLRSDSATDMKKSSNATKRTQRE